jgi:hypothetical protein
MRKTRCFPWISCLASMQRLYKRRRSLALKAGNISKKRNAISIFCIDCMPGKYALVHALSLNPISALEVGM